MKVVATSLFELDNAVHVDNDNKTNMIITCPKNNGVTHKNVRLYIDSDIIINYNIKSLVAHPIHNGSRSLGLYMYSLRAYLLS